MQRTLFLGLALGCARPLTPPAAPIPQTATPVAAPTPPAEPAPDAPSTAREDRTRDAVLAGLRQYLTDLGGPPRTWTLALQAGPWAVRERGSPTPFAAALVESPELGNDPGRCLWLTSVAPERPEVPARLQELGCEGLRPDVVEMLVRDVDGDGGDELIMLSRATPTPDAPANLRIAVFTVDTSLGSRWENLSMVEWQIDGSHDAASVDAALASRGRDEAPREGTSPERFLARLAVATPAGFRAGLGAGGLQVCETPGRSRPRCRTAAAAQLGDAQVVALQHRYFALGTRTGTDPPGFFIRSCRRVANATRCSADEYTDNVSLAWTITGVGASMRLTRVQSHSARE